MLHPFRVRAAVAVGLLCAPPGIVFATAYVPNEVQMPGTQPGQVTNLRLVASCDLCHGQFNPDTEPVHQWRGSPMAHAARDPIFYAALAVAEQDYPGAGNLCLRCHAPRAFLEGRTTATDGSGLSQLDVDGVECAVCHALVTPNDAEYAGVQTAPYLAHDGGTPKRSFLGSGAMVLWGGTERMGPYGDGLAAHPALRSEFLRSNEACGTCHDVSNPVTGDLAHNNGAMVPLAPGTFSGVVGAPVAQKAAFKNFPYQYGVVERTFSEAQASALGTTRVSAYGTLPAELQDGAIANARANALLSTPTGDYADGTPRSFTCQTCHMPPVYGDGCRFSQSRQDLPVHDLVGANYWLADAILHQDANNALRFGGGLGPVEIAGMRDGQTRARRQLELAARVTVRGDVVRVVNLTGHKLFTGYPEGRRMWLHLEWFDESGQLVRQDGGYGPMQVQVRGRPYTVETLYDLAGTNTKIYEAKLGITQQWAQQLLGLGLAPTLPLAFDRMTGAVRETLGQFAGRPAAPDVETFHFVLNNTMVSDNRVPPYGLRYDDARERNCTPVPASSYGNPGPGGTYRHWDELALTPPRGAVAARVRLMYQPTSFEYVQFLASANDGSVPYLAQEGQKLFDTWLATTMAKPHPMAVTAWCGRPGTGDDLRLTSEVNAQGDVELAVKSAAGGDTYTLRVESPGGGLSGAPAAIVLQAHATGAAPTPLPMLGVHLARVDGQVLGFVTSSGMSVVLNVPLGLVGATVRAQGIALDGRAGNGAYATTCAHDVVLR